MLQAPARRSRAGLCAFLYCLPVASAVAEVTITPSVAVGATYIDNITLLPDDAQKVDEVVFQVNPALEIRQRARRAESDLVYTMQNLLYADDSDRNETFHQLDAVTDVTLLSDFLFVEAGTAATQQLVDPQSPANTNNLFDVGNIADVRTVRVQPYISRRMEAVEVNAAYGRAIVKYDAIDGGTGLPAEDTVNTDMSASLAAPDQEAPFSWRVRYNGSKTDYDVSPDYAFDTGEIELGWAVTGKFRLLAIGGVETDLAEDTTSGGFDSGFWSAGFRWRPNPRNELQVLAGERFFGDSYSANWRRQGRLLQFTLSYVEEPTTVSQVFAFDRQPPSTTEPETQTDLRLTNEVYVRRNLQSTLSMAGRRTDFELNVFGEQRRYVVSQQFERTEGVEAGIRRRTGSRVTVGANASWQRTGLREGQDFDDIEFRLLSQITLGPSSTLSAVARRIERTGDLEDYAVHTLSITWEREF